LAADLLGKRETLRDRGERVVGRARLALQLCEKAMPHMRRLRVLPLALRHKVPELGRGARCVARDEAASLTRPFPGNAIPKVAPFPGAASKVSALGFGTSAHGENE
jgi:hypothetical protein